MCKRFVLMRTAGDVGPYKHAVVYACKSQFIFENVNAVAEHRLRH